MLQEAKFFKLIFSKAEDLGFKFTHTEDGFQVVYPNYNHNQFIEVNTDEGLASVLSDVINWKQ